VNVLRTFYPAGKNFFKRIFFLFFEDTLFVNVLRTFSRGQSLLIFFFEVVQRTFYLVRKNFFKRFFVVLWGQSLLIFSLFEVVQRTCFRRTCVSNCMLDYIVYHTSCYITSCITLYATLHLASNETYLKSKRHLFDFFFLRMSAGHASRERASQYHHSTVSERNLSEKFFFPETFLRFLRILWWENFLRNLTFENARRTCFQRTCVWISS
jgi:hypothetical protein